MLTTLNVQTLETMIKCAIDTKKVIRIAYTDKEGDETLRYVEPIKWVTLNEGVGILTKCHKRDGSYRQFYLHKINRIIITDYDFVWVNEKEVKHA